jgi:predicted methyltransferase
MDNLSEPSDRIRRPFTIVLSHFQAEDLIEARRRDVNLLVSSLDLGLSQAEVHLTEDHVLFPEGIRLKWEHIHQIHEDENNCFLVRDCEIVKIIAFSEMYGRVYSLMPTISAPTLLISGIPMHRIKGTDPHQDTLAKVRTVRPLHGAVLDTATGLGYTAIEAASSARHVITIELDPEVIAIARHNPWSRRLFEDASIERRIGDSAVLVQTFEDRSMDIVLHDPPTIALGGDLYSKDFYGHLHRVLKDKGRLFHYIGNPDSPSGRSTTSGVIRRLSEVGFRDIRRVPEAFGVIAWK